MPKQPKRDIRRIDPRFEAKMAFRRRRTDSPPEDRQNWLAFILFMLIVCAFEAMAFYAWLGKDTVLEQANAVAGETSQVP